MDMVNGYLVEIRTPKIKRLFSVKAKNLADALSKSGPLVKDYAKDDASSFIVRFKLSSIIE